MNYKYMPQHYVTRLAMCNTSLSTLETVTFVITNPMGKQSVKAIYFSNNHSLKLACPNFSEVTIVRYIAPHFPVIVKQRRNYCIISHTHTHAYDVIENVKIDVFYL